MGILEKLTKDFPGHVFSIEEMSLSESHKISLLQIDGCRAKLEYSVVPDSYFLPEGTLTADELLYQEVRKAVAKMLEKELAN